MNNISRGWQYLIRKLTPKQSGCRENGAKFIWKCKPTSPFGETTPAKIALEISLFSKRRYIYNWWIFHGYVRWPEDIFFLFWQHGAFRRYWNGQQLEKHWASRTSSSHQWHVCTGWRGVAVGHLGRWSDLGSTHRIHVFMASQPTPP